MSENLYKRFLNGILRCLLDDVSASFRLSIAQCNYKVWFRHLIYLTSENFSFGIRNVEIFLTRKNHQHFFVDMIVKIDVDVDSCRAYCKMCVPLNSRSLAAVGNYR